MKLTTKQLKKLIKEELAAVINETDRADQMRARMVDDKMQRMKDFDQEIKDDERETDEPRAIRGLGIAVEAVYQASLRNPDRFRDGDFLSDEVMDAANEALSKKGLPPIDHSIANQIINYLEVKEMIKDDEGEDAGFVPNV